jgi:rubrerythrin
MLDESKYPTLKYMKCKKCGHVFTGSLTGDTDCPECASFDTSFYQPFESSDAAEGGSEGKSG